MQAALCVGIKPWIPATVICDTHSSKLVGGERNKHSPFGRFSSAGMKLWDGAGRDRDCQVLVARLSFFDSPVDKAPVIKHVSHA